MSGQADVKSIDTLAFVKAAVATFAHETGQAISEVELEGRRAVEYLTMERAAHWKAEVRRGGEQVNQAIKDLEYCRAFKKVGDGQPACVEEKKKLEKARARLAYAEQKAEAVRRWTPLVQQQFRETCVKLVHFREVVDVKCPRAMAALERMLKALDAYRDVSAPRGADAAAGGGSATPVTRQVDDASDSAVAPPGGKDPVVP